LLEETQQESAQPDVNTDSLTINAVSIVAAAASAAASATAAAPATAARSFELLITISK
jgi:hypothetical protein